jgi:hypothetical protein
MRRATGCGHFPEDDQGLEEVASEICIIGGGSAVSGYLWGDGESVRYVRDGR